MALDGFERRVERMVEGVFSRAFRSQLKPIELGRRLVKEMDAGRSLDVRGRAIVPNAFRYTLASSDRAAFADIEGPLTRELVEAAKEHARQEGYGFLGPITVEFVEASHLRAGRFELTAQMRERATTSVSVNPSAVPAPQPAAYIEPAEQTYSSTHADEPATELGTASPAAAAAASTASPHPASESGTTTTTSTRSVTLVGPDGNRLALRMPARVGRMPDCDLVVNDPNVSRQHFEVRPQPDGTWLLVDLGSTNGTRVNGAPVGEHRLADGDVILVGGARITVEVR